MLVSIIGGIIAFQSGHGAEETVERIAGISESAIEEHEELAEVTVVLLYATGILSLVCLYALSKDKNFAKPVLFGVVATTVITFYFVARTTSLGGKIRHTEVSDQRGNENSEADD